MEGRGGPWKVIGNEAGNVKANGGSRTTLHTNVKGRTRRSFTRAHFGRYKSQNHFAFHTKIDRRFQIVPRKFAQEKPTIGHKNNTPPAQMRPQSLSFGANCYKFQRARTRSFGMNLLVHKHKSLRACRRRPFNSALPHAPSFFPRAANGLPRPCAVQTTIIFAKLIDTTCLLSNKSLIHPSSREPRTSSRARYSTSPPTFWNKHLSVRAAACCPACLAPAGS